MRRLGWIIAVVLMLTGLVAGCGAARETGEGASEANAALTGAEPVQTEVTAYEEASEDAEQDDGKTTRTVNTPTGDVEIPVDPQRIVLTYDDDIDHFMALGLKPAAVPTYQRSDNIDGYMPYLAEEMKGIEKLGSTPDPEVLLGAEPDLIIAGWHFRDMLADLNKIAPTLYFEWQTDWRKTHLEMGKALGLEDKAQANIDAFEAEVRKTKEVLDPIIGDDPVAFVRLHRKELSLYGVSGQVPAFLLYELLGFTPVEEAPKDDWGTSFSLESFASLKAEHLFLYVNGTDEDTGLKEQLLQDPLYQNVPAIQKGQVYLVPSFPWERGGPIAFTGGMKDLRELVTGVDE